MQAAEAKDSRLAAVKVGQAAYQAVQANRYMEAARAEDGTAAARSRPVRSSRSVLVPTSPSAKPDARRKPHSGPR